MSKRARRCNGRQRHRLVTGAGARASSVMEERPLGVVCRVNVMPIFPGACGCCAARCPALADRFRRHAAAAQSVLFFVLEGDGFFGRARASSRAITSTPFSSASTMSPGATATPPHCTGRRSCRAPWGGRCGHSSQRPHGQADLAQLGDVGDAAVHHHRRTTQPRSRRTGAADTDNSVIARAIHHQKIPRAQLAQGVVQDGTIGASQRTVTATPTLRIAPAMGWMRRCRKPRSCKMADGGGSHQQQRQQCGVAA